MSDDLLRRRLLWHGWVNLLIGMLLGIPIAMNWHPQAWATIHIPQITSGIMIVVTGLLWRDLRLTSGQKRWAFWLTLAAIYIGLVVGIFNGIVDMPGPISQPNAAAPPVWQFVASGVPGFVALVAVFWSVGLVLRGLSGPPPTAP